MLKFYLSDIIMPALKVLVDYAISFISYRAK